MEYGTQFSTYAVPKIAGEIRRFLRDDGTIKVSRTLKERSAMIKLTRQRLVAKLGREPYLSELSTETGLDPEEIAIAETATTAAESIQKRTGEDGPSLEDILTTGAMEEEILDRISIEDAISRLPQREQTVIRLRYFHSLTQDKTAKVMGISQVQVSRIEKRTLLAMRKYLSQE